MDKVDSHTARNLEKERVSLSLAWTLSSYISITQSEGKSNDSELAKKKERHRSRRECVREMKRSERWSLLAPFPGQEW